uniref:Uncharacterized protein n=1 Tax=Anguilla anguilla TaxID=7936 RepID=A0A0E9TND9_ANGAN
MSCCNLITMDCRAISGKPFYEEITTFGLMQKRTVRKHENVPAFERIHHFNFYLYFVLSFCSFLC